MRDCIFSVFSNLYANNVYCSQMHYQSKSVTCFTGTCNFLVGCQSENQWDTESKRHAIGHRVFFISYPQVTALKT